MWVVIDIYLGLNLYVTKRSSKKKEWCGGIDGGGDDENIRVSFIRRCQSTSCVNLCEDEKKQHYENQSLFIIRFE